MGRLEAHIPNDLLREIEHRNLPICEWVEQTIRAELEQERDEKRAGLERYIEELVAEFGEPTPEEMAEAGAWVDRLMDRDAGRAPEQHRARDLVEYAYTRRMSRVQAYLPEDLYRQLKDRGMSASELLQNAIRTELRRQEKLDAAERYFAALAEEVGEPTPAEMADAEAWVDRVFGPEQQQKAS